MDAGLLLEEDIALGKEEGEGWLAGRIFNEAGAVSLRGWCSGLLLSPGIKMQFQMPRTYLL